jgi:uncharacterized protein YbbC (DUF1343 family)
MTWEETGLPFVPTSPAMAHLSAVYQYPGACLIEGTNLSEGRGTAIPFEIVGAPFIDAAALAERLNALELPGVRFRPHSFTPSTSKHAGETCYGVQVHRMSAEFRSLLVWIAVIAAIRQMYPDRFEWLAERFAHLSGSAGLRDQIERGDSAESIVKTWEDDLSAFDALRRGVMLYA